jgi:hypothetical protein
LGEPKTGGFLSDDNSSLTADFSDFCEASDSSGTAYPGSDNPPSENVNDNICADPKLVDDTYTPPVSAATTRIDGTATLATSDPINCAETSSSPTIDAGLNALVASGLTSDIYGNTRAVSRNCPVSGGTVDIGAAEYIPTCTVTPAPSVVTTPTPTPTPAPSKAVPCTSRRNIIMHLQYTFFLNSPALISRSSARLTSLSIAGFGNRKLKVFGPHGSEVLLDLKTLPFGTYRVHAHITLSNGKSLYQQREWHTCRPFHWKYPPGKPRP